MEEEIEIGNKILSFLSQIELCKDDFDVLLKQIETDLVYNLEQFTSKLLKNGHINQAKWIFQLCYNKVNNKSIIFAFSFSKFLSVHCNEHIKALEVINHFLIHPNLYSKSHYYGLLCENSDNIKGCIVDQWHFRMLNDESRNITYQNSIIKAIKHIELLNNKLGNNNKIIRVLDIGSGSGLLGIYAAKYSSNVQVYCCELNNNLANISKQIIKDNNVQNQITVIPKHSSDIIIGNLCDDIPYKVDLIITELVDAGLLGEHIINTLNDAYDRLLASNGLIIPNKAIVYGCPIESNIIDKRQNIIYNKSCIITPNEKYTCENLDIFPHKFLSIPMELLTVYFINEQKIKDQNIINMKINSNGNFDGFVYWFDLYLLDPVVDNNIYNTNEYKANIVSTRPGISSDLCWDQAILFSSHINCEIKKFNIDEEYIIKCNHSDDEIYIDIKSNNNFKSTDNNIDNIDRLYIDEMEIFRLNDKIYVEKFLYGIKYSLLKLKNLSNILEISNNYLSFLIEVQKNNSIKCDVYDNIALGHIFCSSQEALDYFKEIIKKINASENKTMNLKFNNGNLIEAYANDEENISNDKFPIIICDVVEGNGLIRQDYLQQLKFAFEFMSTLSNNNNNNGIQRSINPSPIIIPYSISIITILIECENLTNLHHVSSNRTSNVLLHDRMNDLSVNRIFELDLSNNNYNFLSQPKEVMKIDLLTIVKSNDSHIFSSNVKLNADFKKGTAHAIGYWYKLHMTDNQDNLNDNNEENILNTGPFEFHSKINEINISHYRQAALLLDAPIILINENSYINVEFNLNINYGIICNIV